MNYNNGFEEAIQLALEIVEKSIDKEKTKSKLIRVLEAHREKAFIERLEEIRVELGIWENII